MKFEEYVREEGREEGSNRTKLEVTRQLLEKHKMTVREIASLLDVTEYFVRKVKRNETQFS